ncbi:MAG: phage tail protein [Acidimicrobiia bacterium]
MPYAEDAPLVLSNRFKVVLTGEDRVDLGSWSKVDGLEVSWDIVEYRAGDGGNAYWYYPGNTKYSTVKLTRGVCADTNKVRAFLSDSSFKHKKFTGSVEVYDAKAETAVATWELKNVLPSRWSITGFDASASKVATETLELIHLGFLDDEMQL